MGDGKGTEEYGVEYGEDGGVRADTQSQRKHGHNGESGIFQEQANGVAQVLQQGPHASPSVRVRYLRNDGEA